MADPLTNFKYSSIEWDKANPLIVDAVLAQYLQRLETSQKDFDAVDGKGKYGLSGMLGITTVLIAWAGKNIQSVDKGIWPISILIAGFVISAICFTVSLWPRPTSGTGVTPTGMKLDGWKTEIQSQGEIGLLQIKGQVICQYADNILCNEETVGKKSKWIRNGIFCSVLTLLFAAAIFMILIISE